MEKEKLEKKSLHWRDVLDLIEACMYTGLSRSYMYKLTSARKIPHYCPGGKKIYFKRSELNEWMLKNRRASIDEIDQAAIDYVYIKK